MADLNDPDVLEQIIAGALKARDMKAVEAALRVLATVDPHRAETVMETCQLGLTIAGRIHQRVPVAASKHHAQEASDD